MRRRIAPLPVLLALLLSGCGGEEPVAPASLDEQLAEQGQILVSGGAGADGAVAERIGESPATEGAAAVTIDYPLHGSVFPPDLVAPTFLWHDEATAAGAWLVEVRFTQGDPLRILVAGPPPPRGPIDTAALGPTNKVYEPTPYQASARSWKPEAALWAEVLARSVEAPAEISIAGIDPSEPGRRLSVGSVAISTSPDPVGAPIFYRDVPLMPSKGEGGKIQPLGKFGLPLIAWRLRDVSQPESRVLLTGMPACANCHSFSLDGKTMGMDVDGPDGDKGAYMIAPVEEHMVVTNDDVITWNSFEEKPEGHKTIGFLSRISPDGHFALTTLNESLYVSNFTDFRFLQVFYPTRGILAWTTKETGEIKALPGADDTAYVQCDPAWYPDGKQIVFARAKAFDPHPPGQLPAEFPNDPKEPKIQYDLYRMPFADGAGGAPVRIEGASANGMSNTFPKVSPDGKWIVYTKCANGQLMRPDGRLWIVPAEGGEAREMRCNTSRMNSWHSFSPNGRWMVFSSKANTPYTQMFLTHIDEDGNDTPPILIPDSTAANRAVNIPEFLNAAYEDLLDIQIPAVNHHRFFGRAVELMADERFEEAADLLEQAVALDPEFSRAHVNLAYCLFRQGHAEKAKGHYERAFEINPRDTFALKGLGDLAEAQGRPDEAMKRFRQVIDVNPGDPAARRRLGMMMAERGRLDEALVHLRRYLASNPKDTEVHETLANLLLEHRRTKQALPFLEAVVALDPTDVRARTRWAWILATSPDDAVRDADKAIQHAREACRQTKNERPEPLDALAAAYAEAGQFEEAVRTADQALQLLRGAGWTVELTKRRALYRRNEPYRAP